MSEKTKKKTARKRPTAKKKPAVAKALKKILAPAAPSKTASPPAKAPAAALNRPVVGGPILANPVTTEALVLSVLELKDAGEGLRGTLVLSEVAALGGSQAAVYSTLAKLKSRGLVVSAKIPNVQGPSRRFYLSAEGEKVALRTMTALVGIAMLCSPKAEKSAR